MPFPSSLPRSGLILFLIANQPPSVFTTSSAFCADCGIASLISPFGVNISFSTASASASIWSFSGSVGFSVIARRPFYGCSRFEAPAMQLPD